MKNHKFSVYGFDDCTTDFNVENAIEFINSIQNSGEKKIHINCEFKNTDSVEKIINCVKLFYKGLYY